MIRAAFSNVSLSATMMIWARASRYEPRRVFERIVGQQGEALGAGILVEADAVIGDVDDRGDVDGDVVRVGQRAAGAVIAIVAGDDVERVRAVIIGGGTVGQAVARDG